MNDLASSAWRRFAQGLTPEAQPERCELCSEPLPGEHRHLLDLEGRSVLCACRACGLLFDPSGAGGHRYRLIGDRRRRLEGFVLRDEDWAAFGIPVDMAYFSKDSPTGRVRGFYPSPLGATEAQIDQDAWTRLVERNPVLDSMPDDVEALLVDRRDDASRHFLVPLDDCFALVATVRTHWRGLAGGDQVWREIDSFFERLERDAIVVAPSAM